ncbi:MAG TPA: glycoside hydrolase family 3 N-terminal domain-containing protein, partial [Kribbella sp.]|nr:glycoside hydrolase family 3 N-terminal domain-containing protein [Kribbella sp.]
MSDQLDRDAAGSLVVGFTGTTAPDDLRRAVAGGLGAVILFTRNVADAEQVAELTAALRAERPDLIVAIDHEGGEFSHLAPANPWPLASPRLLGDLDDVELTRAAARDAAATLASLGIDLMLAPSVDVNSNPANPIISTRSFGRTADVVSRHGVAFVEGVHDAGIAACPKHFPGHGDVSVDSHTDLPRVDRSIEEVQA